MKNFKSGDKVQVVEDASTVWHIPTGTVGTVVRLTPDVLVDCGPPWGERIFRGGEGLEILNDAVKNRS